MSSVGDIHLDRPYNEMDFNEIEKNPVRCPDPEKAKEMEAYIRQIRKEGDTVGGIITCVIENVPLALVSLLLISYMPN